MCNRLYSCMKEDKIMVIDVRCFQVSLAYPTGLTVEDQVT